MGDFFLQRNVTKGGSPTYIGRDQININHGSVGDVESQLQAVSKEIESVLQQLRSDLYNQDTVAPVATELEAVKAAADGLDPVATKSRLRKVVETAAPYAGITASLAGVIATVGQIASAV